MSEIFNKLGPLGAAVSMTVAAVQLYNAWSNEKAARDNIEAIFINFVLHQKTGLPRQDRMDFTEAQLRFVTTALHVTEGTLYYLEVTRIDLPGTDRKRTRGILYGARHHKFRYR